jgi:hypothetical protein
MHATGWKTTTERYWGFRLSLGVGPFVGGVLVSSKFGIGVMGVRGAPGESCLDQEHFELIGRRKSGFGVM